MKTNNDLIAEFMGEPLTFYHNEGFGHVTERKFSYETKYKEWNGLIPVVEQISNLFHYQPYFSKQSKPIDIIISPTYCSIHYPDTSEGFDYKNDCYYADPLFKIYITGNDMITNVYQAVIEFIKYINNNQVLQKP